jgi:hypothetical protein
MKNQNRGAMVKNILLIFVWIGLLFTFCSQSDDAPYIPGKKVLTLQEQEYLKVIKNEDKPVNGEWDFNLKEEWWVDSAGDNPLVWVSSVWIDDDGTVYLLDGKYGKVAVFSSQGKFLFSFGKQGEGPGELMQPGTLFLVGKYLVIQDIGNRIHYFTKKGEFVDAFKSGIYTRPKDFLDEFSFITLRSNPEKKQEKETLEIYNFKTGKKAVIAEVTSEIPVEASNGEGSRSMNIQIGDKNLSIKVITGIDTCHKEIYFGRNDTYTIKKTDLNGSGLLSFSIGGRKRKPVPLWYKKSLLEPIIIGGKKLSKELGEKLIKNMPDHSNYFNNIVVDETGLIYVYVTDITNKSGQEIDIFSSQGKYLYHANIELPKGLRSRGTFVIKGEHLYAFVEEENGNRKLFKYKIQKPSQ